MIILMILVFVMIEVSGVNSETFVLFGGCANFCKAFSTLISMCQISSSGFCALRLTLPDYQTLLLFLCVYLPFDNSLFGPS